MRNHFNIFFFWMIAFLFPVIPGYAVKANSTPVTFVRPDGTRIAVKIYGDEFFSYKKDAEGFLVEQGKDGFLYYADYQTGELRLSRNKTPDIPYALFSAIRERNIRRKHPSSPQLKSGLPVGSSRFFPAGPVLVKVPVLLAEFADVKFTTASPVTRFSAQLNQAGYALNGATGSAADYFNENFDGRYSFVFEVFPVVVKLPETKSYYGEDGASGVDANITKLFQDLCKAAVAAGFNFTGYDWAGDNRVPDVSVIYAGTSQAETGQPGDIWPQYQSVNDMSYQGKTIGAFSCSSELSAVGLLTGQMAGIGTFCHEFAHSLGLPDMYDTNGETEGLSSGLWGNLSLMDTGNYLNSGRTPPYFTAIEREMLGHPVSAPVPGTSYELAPVWSGGKIFRIDSEIPGEYFLIECRNQQRWDTYIKGGGMVVYHVDKSEQVYGGISSVMRWQYNNINAFSEHPCARLFTPSSGNGENLFFPGVAGNTQLSSYGKPWFADWSDKPLKIHLSGISYDKKTVRFNAIPGQTQNASLPHAVAYRTFPYQYDCRISWSIPEGEPVPAGEWRIRWRPVSEQKTGVVWEEFFTSDNHCYLSHLKPATEYEVSIVFEKENLYGEGLVFRCSSLAITSLMPYIQGKSGYTAGEILDLRVLNLTGEYERIAWFVNGKDRSNDLRLLLNAAGMFTLRAEIQYKDRTKEYIVKKIKVN